MKIKKNLSALLVLIMLFIAGSFNVVSAESPQDSMALQGEKSQAPFEFVSTVTAKNQVVTKFSMLTTDSSYQDIQIFIDKEGEKKHVFAKSVKPSTKSITIDNLIPENVYAFNIKITKTDNVIDSYNGKLTVATKKTSDNKYSQANAQISNVTTFSSNQETVKQNAPKDAVVISDVTQKQAMQNQEITIMGTNRYEVEYNDAPGSADRFYDDDNMYGLISSTTDVDYFVISFPNSGSTNFTLGTIPSGCDYDLYLFDSNGSTLLASSTKGSNADELITYTVNASQNYYLKVFSYSGSNTSTYYTLRGKSLVSGDYYEPNDTMATATSIGENSSVAASLHVASDVDYFRFTVSSYSNVNVGLNNIPAGCDFDLYLYDSASVVKGTSTAGSNNPENISLALNPGTYYARVYSYSGSSTSYYTLSVSSTPIASTLPVSGYEVPYQPSKWNDGGTIQYSTNCYAYALNLQKDPVSGDSFPLPWGSGYCLQPGELAHYTFDWTSALNDTTGSYFITACEKDATAIGGTFSSVARYSACPTGTYKVALVLDQGYDYHWYRQNPDGTWSHKPGTTPVRDLDNATPGQKIYDPQLANRGGYETFVGYFAVKSIPGGAPSPIAARITAAPVIRSNFVSIETDITQKAMNKTQFNFLKLGMKGTEVRSVIGLPQGNYGSGIIMDAYNLDDGSTFVISYGAKRDMVTKAFIVHQDGTREVILK